MTTSNRIDPSLLDSLNEEAKKAALNLVKEYPPAAEYLNIILGQTADNDRSKKRKLANLNSEAEKGKLLIVLNELSFQNPRKKLDLLVYENVLEFVAELKANATSQETFNVRSYNNKQGQVLNSLDISKIQIVLVLNTPEKASKFKTIVIQYEDDFFHFICPAESPKLKTSCIDEGLSQQLKVFNSSTSFLLQLFKELKIKNIHETDSSIFKSKSGNDFVNCHIKSKEYFIFFLKEFLFIGFKKPCYVFELSLISSCELYNLGRYTFEMKIKSNNDNTVLELSNIEISELELIVQYLRDTKVKNILVAGVGYNLTGDENAQVSESVDQIQVVKAVLSGNSGILDQEFGSEDHEEDEDYETETSGDDESGSEDSSDGSEDGNDDSDSLSIEVDNS